LVLGNWVRWQHKKVLIALYSSFLLQTNNTPDAIISANN
jgi:hypothetical protein